MTAEDDELIDRMRAFKDSTLDANDNVIRRSDIEVPDTQINDNIVLRSKISSTSVGTVNITHDRKTFCTTCNNEINGSNKRLVCEICHTSEFCEACDEQMTRAYEFMGYKLDLDWPLCRKCYQSEVERQKFDIKYGFLEGYIPVKKEEPGSFPKLESLNRSDFKPMVTTSREDDLAKICAYASIVLGVISIFVMGFLLGIPAILLGYAAKVRKNPLGNYGIIFGLLGLASSIFWFLLTGGGVWFL